MLVCGDKYCASQSSELSSGITMRFQMSPLSAQNSNHVLLHAGSVALAVITQVILDIIFILAKESCVPNALFQTSSRNVSETFPLEVTLDGWSQNFWIVIDFWSKCWLLYAVVGLCKRNVLGPESCNPEIHPPVFYQMWTMINIARMCSMSLWARHYILGAVAVEWIVPVFSFYMLYVSYSNLNKHKRWLAINNPNIISWTRYLIQNGLAVFAWWSVLHAMVGLGIVFKYKAGVADPPISTAILTIIALFVIIWFILQIFLLTKYLRYTFCVYTILVLGLGAMFTRSYRIHELSVNTIYCGFLMLVMTIMSFFHLMSECLCGHTSSDSPASEPYVMFEGCKTVCQPAVDIKHKPQK